MAPRLRDSRSPEEHPVAVADVAHAEVAEGGDAVHRGGGGAAGERGAHRSRARVVGRCPRMTCRVATAVTTVVSSLASVTPLLRTCTTGCVVKTLGGTPPSGWVATNNVRTAIAPTSKFELFAVVTPLALKRSW